MRTFEFKKSYEEVEINSKVYKLDMSDDKIQEYQRLFIEFYKRTQEIEKEFPGDEFTVEQQQEFMNKSTELLKETVDALLGEGSFDVLYVESGKSLMNVTDLLVFITDVVKDRIETTKEDKASKYLKKKKAK
jgi:hypothetical protein